MKSKPFQGKFTDAVAKASIPSSLVTLLAMILCGPGTFSNSPGATEKGAKFNSAGCL